MAESGVTYRELAARTGLSAGYLNHLVHGNRPVPSNDVVRTLAEGPRRRGGAFPRVPAARDHRPARGDARADRPACTSAWASDRVSRIPRSIDAGGWRMAAVSFDGVTKTYPDGTTAVNDLDLEIADGEFMVLVGPSGCGKTTALRMVAGLEDISRGVLKIGERIVNHVPSRDRDIAMVFQSYALYPHLTVYDNIAFGLKIKKVPKEEIEKRVSEAARILDLEPYLKRKPRALSGGQRQRVAMGRAIVREPSAFLMDEPLSNLDAKLRVQMRAEIAGLQRDARRHDDLRHARPGRGDDDGRPRRGDAQGRAAAGRRSADALRPSGQPLRRRLHRQPRDEHARGDARARERRDRREARLAVDRARRGDPRRRTRRSAASRARTSCSASGRKTSRTSRSPATRRTGSG